MRLTFPPHLIARLRQRDNAAFNEVLASAGPPLTAFVMSYGLPRDDAEDVVQTVFVHIWQLGDRFVPVGTLEAYLFAAARNETLKALRNAGIRDRNIRRYADDAIYTTAASDQDAADDVATIRQRLAKLTEHQRTAFELRYGQQMTIPEVARVLGITPKGVERLMTRVNALLREWMLKHLR